MNYTEDEKQVAGCDPPQAVEGIGNYYKIIDYYHL